MRQRSDVCLELLNRFRCFRSYRAPIQPDEHGYFRYLFEQMQDQPEEGRHMVVRVYRGRVADDFGKAVESLVQHVRVEVHGQGAIR